MDDTKVSGASKPIEISGRTLHASPLTDKQLDELTNYVRYIMGKRAKGEASFAATPEEAREILEVAFNAAQAVVWFEPAALSILSDPKGTAIVAAAMVEAKHPDIDKEWLSKQFGTTRKINDEQLENTIAVREAFGELNSFVEKVSDEKEVKKSKKKPENRKQ